MINFIGDAGFTGKGIREGFDMVELELLEGLETNEDLNKSSLGKGQVGSILRMQALGPGVAGPVYPGSCKKKETVLIEDKFS